MNFFFFYYFADVIGLTGNHPVSTRFWAGNHHTAGGDCTSAAIVMVTAALTVYFAAQLSMAWDREALVYLSGAISSPSSA